MIALIIIGAVVLLIAVLMSLPIVFVIDYKKEAEIKIRLLFFDLFKEKEPKKRKSKRIKKQKPAKPAERRGDYQSPVTPAPSPSQPPKTTTPPPKKKKLEKNIPDLDINLIKMLIDSVAHPVKKLIKKIKITELNIDSTVGGSDAAKAAINFGLQNAAIYAAIAWLKTVSNVKTERISIQPDFMREDSEFSLHCKIKIKTGTVIVCALAFMFKIMKLKANEGAPQTSRRGGVGKTIRIVMD